VNVQQAMALAGHKDTRTHMRYVDLSQGGPLETPGAALPVLGKVLPLLGTKLPALREPENDNPAVFTGDPNENRTRVIGVRGAPNSADPAQNMLDSSPGTVHGRPPETARNGPRGRNSRGKIQTRFVRCFAPANHPPRWRAVRVATMRVPVGARFVVGTVGEGRA
jgi:hypothetical protein